jgi:GTP-binding protein HflX
VSDALSRSFHDIDVELGVDNGRMLAYLAANGDVLSKTFHDSTVVVHCRISQHFLSRVENDGVVIRPHANHNGQVSTELDRSA